MKARRKQLLLSIEYIDVHDAETVLKKVILALQGRVQSSDNHSDNNISYEWSIAYLENTDYREEMIDGKWCIVLQSKMNKL